MNMNEYKIKVDGNRVIFDGHAEDLETCNAITQICNALKQTQTTIECKEGYAEFEVDEAEEKMFPGASYIYVYSNDGSTKLWLSGTLTSYHVTVVNNGLEVYKSDDTLYSEYEYSEGNVFLGFSTSPNASVPEKVSGDTVPYNAKLYLVEKIVPKTTVKYNDVVIAEVPPGETVTLDTKDKWLSSRIEITSGKTDVSDATVTAGDLLSGKIAYGKDSSGDPVKIIGAIPVYTDLS